MRDLLNLLSEAAETGEKIDRSAFIYLPPKPPVDRFAQCATCVHFMPDAERCALFSDKAHAKASDSCGLYLHGDPSDDQTCQSIVTPEEAGYVTGPVRCTNCSWYDGACGLYETLNKSLPEVFDLDPAVDENGCCNAWQRKT